MKIVKYIGGLGNQMFIYSFQYLLQKHYGETIYADTLYYKDHKFHNGLELENIFDIKLTPANVRDILKLAYYIPNYYLDYHLRRYLPNRKHQYYEPEGGAYTEDVFTKDRDRYYFGYWQDHKYYDAIHDELMSAFRFKHPLDDRNESIADEMLSSENSVAVHVRRGDYVTHHLYKDICTEEYYTKAIDVIKSKVDSPVYYVFSNDIAWCKEKLAPIIGDAKIIYVDWNCGKDSYRDMQLMSLCKSLIIANSSFSWWGTYLNGRKPLVVAPKKWVNEPLAFEFTLDEWVKI